MKVSEALRSARTKIEKIENWVQGSFAKSKSGMSVECRSDAGFAFCLLGSIQHVCWLNGRDDEWYLTSLVEACAKELFQHDPVTVNDSEYDPDISYEEAHRNVLSILDCTIGRAETAENVLISQSEPEPVLV